MDRLSKLVILIVLLMSGTNALPQKYNPEIDSLIRLSTTVHDTLRDDISNTICWKLRNNYPDMAIQYAMTAIKYAEKTGDYEQLVKGYSYIGVCHRNLGNYTDALEYYRLGLKKAQELKVTDQEAYAYINLGNLYLYQEQYDEAEENLNNGLALGKQLNDSLILSYCYLNLGRTYLGRNQYPQAEENLELALEVRTRIHASQGDITVCKKYLGDIYFARGEIDRAMARYYDCISNEKYLSDIDLQSEIFRKLSQLYYQRQDYDSSEYYGEKSLKLATDIGSKFRIRNAHEILAKLHYVKNEFQDAADHYNQVILYNDSVFSEELTEKLFNIQYKAKTYEQEGKISSLEREKDLLEENNRLQDRFILTLIIFLALGVLMLIVLFVMNKKTKRLNRQLHSQHEEIKSKNIELHNRAVEIAQKHDELEQQNEYIDQQRLMLAQQQKQITDSISYAKRIQDALFPDLAELKSFFKDYFILYSPRDVVSGDFYWLHSDEDKLIFVVADCTGHGVPGAFMSMLGICALHEITGIGAESNAANILERLRKMVKTLLHQEEDKSTMTKDGMDITLVVIDRKERILEYAGANLPLLYIRNGEEFQLKPNRNPIGIYIKEKPFESQRLTLLDGDILYMFSDGYASQFGGEFNMKLKMGGFKDIILKNHSLPLHDQKNLLEQYFEEWKGGSQQIDDITVIGLKV
ncbi:MAG: SpoIIE family protein phosphatase [Bacteroidales bacterium]|nr:SpoIIE family protein phosphatase [Bacteroidales bacterium]